jgi:hypothetical protein
LFIQFLKLDRSQISKQFAKISDEISEMYDEDEDFTPVDTEGNNIRKMTMRKNHMSLLQQPILIQNTQGFNKNDEIIPATVQNKFP